LKIERIGNEIVGNKQGNAHMNFGMKTKCSSCMEKQRWVVLGLFIYLGLWFARSKNNILLGLFNCCWGYLCIARLKGFVLINGQMHAFYYDNATHMCHN